jgi:putative DNA primase/helicase
MARHPRVRDVPKMVDRIARTMTEAAALSSGSDKDVLALVKVYRRLRDAARIKSALEALSWRDDYKTDGSIFDTDPYLIGVRNGVLDLRTLTLHRPDDHESSVREMYVSQSVAVAWPTGDLSAALKSAQPFLDFLLDVLGGDEDLTYYVLRLLGYCLLGTAPEEKFWLAVGEGRNGKGTLLKFMHWLMGDYAVYLGPSLYIRGRWGDPGEDRPRPELGNLWGKRYGVTSEPVKGEFNEQVLKAHTGRDRIKFRRMRDDTLWDFEATHKLFFLTQEEPAVEDVGPSMRARARVIRFEQNYETNGRKDPALQKKLEAIGQAVFVLLAGEARAYLREGLAENPKVQAWSEAYIAQNDPYSQFAAERCETGSGLAATAALVYAAWQDWCAMNDREPGSQVKFGTAFAKRYKRGRTGTGWHYLGLRLLDSTELAETDQEEDSDHGE